MDMLEYGSFGKFMKSVELLKEFEKLRNKNIHLIGVSNSEWYSLLRDEIRNSIAIEGIIANRNELLDSALQFV